jgi:hypothetical protein
MKPKGTEAGLARRWQPGSKSVKDTCGFVLEGRCLRGFEEVGSYELVDGFQGHGNLEESSSGSRGSYWAVALSMTMMIINLDLNLKKKLHEYFKTCKDFLTL